MERLNQMGKDLAHIVRIVEEAAATIADADRDDLGVRTKSSRRDMVTAHDERVQALLVQRLSEAFPDAAYQGEEDAGFSATKGLRFVIENKTQNLIQFNDCPLRGVA